MLRIAQRAMKQMVGYFGGYISKRQKVGQYELKKSIGSLPLLKQRLEKRGVSAGTQLALVCNRMFTTLESKGILRTAPEELMLASQYRPDAFWPKMATSPRAYHIVEYNCGHSVQRHVYNVSSFFNVTMAEPLPQCNSTGTLQPEDHLQSALRLENHVLIWDAALG